MFTLSEYNKIIGLLIGLIGGHADPSAFQGLTAGGHDPAYPVTIEACPRPLGRHEIEGKTIICGTVSVPENHDAPDGRRIDLTFTVLKSHSMYPEPDPVVHLHGGPGGGLLGGLENFAGLFDKWRATRDIVMFDQRAAGLSARSTDCYDAMTSNIEDIIGVKPDKKAKKGKEDPNKAFTQCIAELRKAGVGLKYYNTYENARDVIAIMKTLGYKTYNLYGISYGTKLSLEVMRLKPKGLRAVVLDGVAPPSVHLYDTLAVPENEAIVALVDECKADEACNTAYPDLGAKIKEAYAKAAEGKVVINGEPLPPTIVGIMISGRNGNYAYSSYTAYLPAAIYEIANGGDMPTVKKIMGTLKPVHGKPTFTFERPGPEEVRKAGKTARLNGEQTRMLDIALANAGVFKDGGDSLDLAIDEFKSILRRHRELGPLPELFDAEMIKASSAIFADRARTVALVKDYAALQNTAPSKAPLEAFVRRNFADGDGQRRLLALIGAMTDAEVKTAFEMIHASVGKLEAKFAQNAHLMIYACQEDRPYNTLENYKKVTAGLDYSKLLAAQWDATAKGFHDTCREFEAKPRPGFHDPVVSDIPTLSLGSTWDTQTAASWAKVAVEHLSHAQAFIIPEAGHAAIAYQPCAIDMGVAFINNPERKLDNRCAESIKPTFYIAPWVKK